MCPLAVAMLAGRWRFTLLMVELGNVVRWLFLMALIGVDGDGLKRDWCDHLSSSWLLRVGRM